jgi:DNA-binding response OmpR family regulator
MSDFVLTCPCCGQPVPPGQFQALRSVNLSPQQRAIVNALAAGQGEWVPTDRVVSALYADDPEGGAMEASRVVAVQVWRIKRILRAAGYMIESYHGGGRGGSYRRLVRVSA